MWPLCPPCHPSLSTYLHSPKAQRKKQLLFGDLGPGCLGPKESLSLRKSKSSSDGQAVCERWGTRAEATGVQTRQNRKKDQAGREGEESSSCLCPAGCTQTSWLSAERQLQAGVPRPSWLQERRGTLDQLLPALVSSTPGRSWPPWSDPPHRSWTAFPVPVTLVCTNISPAG